MLNVCQHSDSPPTACCPTWSFVRFGRKFPVKVRVRNIKLFQPFSQARRLRVRVTSQHDTISHRSSLLDSAHRVWKNLSRPKGVVNSALLVLCASYNLIFFLFFLLGWRPDYGVSVWGTCRWVTNVIFREHLPVVGTTSKNQSAFRNSSARRRGVVRCKNVQTLVAPPSWKMESWKKIFR